LAGLPHLQSTGYKGRPLVIIIVRIAPVSTEFVLVSSTLSSMTGFARRDGQGVGHAWTVEVRSVNGKGLDIRQRLPNGYEALDPVIRQLAAERFKRGNISVGLSVRQDHAGGSFRLNRAMVTAVMALSQELEALGAPPQRLDALLAVRGVVEGADDDVSLDDAQRAALLAAISADIAAVLDDLVQSRRAEGARLLPVLTGQIDTIERLCAAAAQTAGARPDMWRGRLHGLLSQLLDGVAPLPEERIAQELALLATRGDVREELDRLAAHLASARAMVSGNGAVGRKLDFLCQEFNREANTLCSKSGDVELTTVGLDLKVIIDQFREQVQNIE
jgi:uncharacterized protein (TIGR00255 family)